MPSFCRHGRIEERCPVCAAKAKKDAAARSGPSRTGRAASSAARRASAGPRSSGPRARPGVTVRREARAADDGYANDLVPGIRATADAARLADELAFACARLDELATSPPGRYAEVVAEPDREEALWLCLQIAALSPLEDEDPWATIDAVRTTWAGGADPEPGDLPLGPRSGIDPQRGAAATFAAYRAWAQRAGSQETGYVGEAAWSPQRRFDRAFERLALPGMNRSARFELLVLVSRLGGVDLEPWTLGMGADLTDPTALAAKRVFGIGDAINLGRRASELCHEADVSAAALDLALRNWGLPPTQPRITAAATVHGDDEVRGRVLAVLGALPVVAEDPDDGSGEPVEGPAV